MDIDRKKGRRNLRVLFLGLALVGVAVVCMCFFMVSSMKSFMDSETERYLEEISHHVAEAVDSRISETFHTLHSVGEVYSRIGRSRGGDAAMDYLRTVAEDYNFARIGISSPEGRMVTTDGYDVDVGGVEAVKRAMAGEQAVSGTLYSLPDGQDVLIYAVPCEWDGRIQGAVAASKVESDLRTSLGVNSFDGAGFSVVIDGMGNVITENGDREARGKVDNFFSLMEREHVLREGYSLDTMRTDMAGGGTGMLYYTLSDGVDKAASYQPLKVPGWYLLSVVPTQVVAGEVRSFIHLTVAIDAAIVLLFLALILLFARLSWRSQWELEQLAFVDGVTGGANKNSFERDAGALIRAAPPGTYVLVSADLQKFKLVNDTFGSASGDRTLRYVYQTFCAGLGAGELAARISGDKFNLLLKNTSREALAARLEGMAGRVNAFNEGAEQPYFLPVFFGAYTVEEPGLDILFLRDRATVAREESKRIGAHGLSSCAFYTDVTRTRMLREKEIEDRMEAALVGGEFVVYLQPKVELRWNTVAGAEALVRWQDPERGLLAPGEFIPVFERNGFVVKLDLYVFEQVCALERRWLDEGKAAMPVSVNLSKVHLRDMGFLTPYRRIREEYGIPEGLLEFEITESLVVENQQGMAAVMDRIHQAGFRCSLDDFGSGYSSLNMLQAVHADVLKLDRTFFTDDSDRGQYVVQSVLSLARKLRMQTVCEGVERPGQLEFLRRAQCDMVQGFVYAKPVPAAEFEAMAFSGKPVQAAGESSGI